MNRGGIEEMKKINIIRILFLNPNSFRPEDIENNTSNRKSNSTIVRYHIIQFTRL